MKKDGELPFTLQSQKQTKPSNSLSKYAVRADKSADEPISVKCWYAGSTFALIKFARASIVYCLDSTACELSADRTTFDTVPFFDGGCRADAALMEKPPVRRIERAYWGGCQAVEGEGEEVKVATENYAREHEEIRRELHRRREEGGSTHAEAPS